jgi:pimeloyl-ACP methyl ester carboxylesterase
VSSSASADMQAASPLVQPAVERIEFAGADGLRLVADAAGPLDGLPVLLLHGGGQTRHSWRRALQKLAAQGWRAIALDARGHGDSDWAPDGDYSMDRLSEDLRAVICTLRTQPMLVGASMGGNTALLAQSEEPALARALVLVDVVPQLESEGIQRIIGFMTARPDGFATLDEAADAVAAYNPSRPRPRDLQGLMKNLRQGSDSRWRWHWDPRFMVADAPQRQARIREIHERMAAAAARVQVPVLLVRGAQSDVVSAEGVEALRALMPQLETAEVQEAGHMVAGDSNDHFNVAVLEFLHRHARSEPLGLGEIA